MIIDEKMLDKKYEEDAYYNKWEKKQKLARCQFKTAGYFDMPIIKKQKE